MESSEGYKIPEKLALTQTTTAGVFSALIKPHPLRKKAL